MLILEGHNMFYKIIIKGGFGNKTVWLSLDQMAKLFDRDKSVISRLIKNALSEELNSSTVVKFATVQKEVNREVTRDIEYYNLD